MDIEKRYIVEPELTEIYSGPPYDYLSGESKILTNIAWEYCSAKAIQDFIEGVKTLTGGEGSPLIRELEYETPFFLVLAPGDENPYSRYRHSSIDCDASEWYMDLSLENRNEINNLDQDRLMDIKEEFEETIQCNLRNFLENKGVSMQDIQNMLARYGNS